MYDPTNFVASAQCGCHSYRGKSEENIPCEHDINLLLKGLRSNPEVRVKGVDDTGNETWESSLADFVVYNREDPESFIPVLNLELDQTVRLPGFTGCYVDVTRIS